MLLRAHPNQPKIMWRIGAASLLVASLAHWFLHPAGRAAQDLADGVQGVLYGVAIGAMLMSLRSSRGGTPESR